MGSWQGGLFQNPNHEFPKYRDQIVQDLHFFPKSVTVLEYSFSLSDPDSYKGYIEDLKPYDLEKRKNLSLPC